METVKVIDDNQESLLWRLRLIAGAKHKIVMCTFKMRLDESGTDIVSALADAAKRGVQVEFLVDAISSNFHCKLNDKIRYLSSLPNVRFSFYNPVFFSNPLRITFRLHDKILLVDDDVYMIGGRNILNVSIGNYSKKYNIDRDVVVLDPEHAAKGSVRQVCRYTEKLWYEGPLKRFVKPLPEAEAKKTEALLRQHYADLCAKNPFILHGVQETDNDEFLPAEEVRLIHGDPNFRYKGLEIWSNLIRFMEKGDDVLVQTPYIMCNRLMYQGIREVIKADREFAIITNAPEAGANYLGCADYLNQRKKIRRYGIRVYECSAGQSLHTKSIMIDDEISIIGSFNFDTRSAYMDTELMLYIRSKELNRKLRDTADQLIRMSRLTDETGQVTYGSDFVKKNYGIKKLLLYGLLRIMVRPFRFFL